eukprot:392064_1
MSKTVPSILETKKIVSIGMLDSVPEVYAESEKTEDTISIAQEEDESTVPSLSPPCSPIRVTPPTIFRSPQIQQPLKHSSMDRIRSKSVDFD